MSLILKQIFKSYHYYFHEIKDPRSEKFFLMSPPLVVFSLLAGYVAMVKYGPRLMKSLEPFELKTVLMVYNLIQVIFNLTLGVTGTYNAFALRPFNFDCHLVNYNTTPDSMKELRLIYCYFLLKVLDLFDTLFIVLKKKNCQLTFLHCYHHFFMAFGTYLAVGWVPGGHLIGLGLLNMVVHSIMYFYFFLTCLNPDLKKSISWKKQITHVQMIQFTLLIIHFLRGAIAKNCTFPKPWSWMLVIQNVFMLTLFTDFYRRTYLKKKTE